MKYISILLFSFACLWVPAQRVMAQTGTTTDVGVLTAVSTDTAARFTIFAGRFLEGRTYLHWSVKGQQCDGVYTVCRSLDGKNFEALGVRKGIGVPVSVPIAWYFQDQDPPAGTAWYRVVHHASDSAWLVSEIIAVTRMAILLTGTE